MKNIERKNILDNKTNNQTAEIVKNLYQFGHINLESGILTKAKVNALQNELKNNFGYQLTKCSIQYLSLYCEYCKKLKEILTPQIQERQKNKSFLEQFSRSHSQDHMSKIFTGFDSINKKIKKENMQYGRQCLITFFQLQQFSQDNLVTLLFNKIVYAKKNRLINFQELKVNQNKRSFYHFEQKQNKIKKSFMKMQNRRNTTEKYSKIHFQILALKVILNSSHLDHVQTNKVCQSIKTDLLNLFEKIKLKFIEDDLKKRKQSILEQK